MIQELKKGHTLVARGPTRITMLEGKVEIFGKILKPEEEKSTEEQEEDTPLFKDESVLIIPSATVYPLHALEKSKLEIYTSKPEENLKVVKENTILDEWIEIKDKILEKLNQNKENPLRIMVLGISSGKTTLIKYLANNFLQAGLKGGYLDSDLGQQVMYLPTTLNIGEIEEPIITSEDLEPDETVFIGATFPKGNYKFIVSHSCNDLINNYIEKNKDTDFVLIDTDGWIKTEAGIIYKSYFIETVDPDVMIVFYDEETEELTKILDNARKKKGRDIYEIEAENKYFYERDKEERRFLRQSQFAKVLETFRKITIPLNDVVFYKQDYDKEEDRIIKKEISPRELIGLPYHYVIIAILTEGEELLRIGLLFSINIEKNYVLLFSDLSYKEQLKAKKIKIGSLRLSTKGNHQGYLYL